MAVASLVGYIAYQASGLAPCNRALLYIAQFLFKWQELPRLRLAAALIVSSVGS